ncbi:MAG: hypothetical protein V4481_01430 [Patescibacteria group bacterium]
MIEFEDAMTTTHTYRPGTMPGQPQHSGIMGWLLKKGMAKTESQARVILLVVAVICIVLALVITYKNLYGGRKYSPEEIQRSVDADLPLHLRQ